MKLHHSSVGLKEEKNGSARRSFFSRAKRHVLTAALAAGMAFSSASAVKAGMNLPAQIFPPSAYDKCARVWFIRNQQYFNFPMSDRRKVAETVAFISKQIKSGLWFSPYRISTDDWPDHPRCTSDMSNGDCWVRGFQLSWMAKPGVKLDDKYCPTSDGQIDYRCKLGKPDKTPVHPCAGYTDFETYVEKCEMLFIPSRP